VLPQNSISTANVKSIDVATDGHTIYLDNGSQPVRATLVVDATGRQGLLSRQLGLTSHQFDQLLAYTVNVPIINHPEINQPVFIEAFEQGWGLVSKLDDKHNVLSLFTNKNSGLMAQLKNWKNWQHLTQHTKYFKHFIPTEDEYNVHCLNASSRIAAKLNADNWLLIGDAAMSFDPLSSHGMTTAIYTAEHAAKALSKARDKPFGNATDCLNDYAKKMTDIYNTYLNELVALYRLESRWSDCGFWQSKQNLIVGESPAVVA
jgi:flavin-dependent dehydrogenase